MQSLQLYLDSTDRAAAETMSPLQITLLVDSALQASEGEMTVVIRPSLRIPKPLVVLALLAIADGITTHIGLARGAHEVNPIMAVLFGVHPLVGESFRIGMWVMVIFNFYRAYRSPSFSRRRLHVYEAIAIAVMGCIVAWNAGQLALLLWLLA